MYEKYYRGALERAAVLSAEKGAFFSELLRLYYDSKRMTCGEFFNKYKLNDVIRVYTKKQNDALWSVVSSAFGEGLSADENGAVRTIVDGAFEKLAKTGVAPI